MPVFHRFKWGDVPLDPRVSKRGNRLLAGFAGIVTASAILMIGR